MKKFVIFGIGRSGSTLLVSLLNTHPSIRCEGELFRRGRWGAWRRPLLSFYQKYPMPYLQYRQLISRCFKHVSVYGFKLHLQHLEHISNRVAQLHASGWSVVYLERHSLFDQTLSAHVARHTQRYHGYDTKDEPVLAPFPLDPDQFRRSLLGRQRRIRRCQAAVSAVPHLSIVYENALNSPELWKGTRSRICAYLDIDAAVTPVTTHLSKPWRRPYSDIVLNYAELLSIWRDFEASQVPESASL